MALALLKQLIAEINPDVVCLQELSRREDLSLELQDLGTFADLVVGASRSQLDLATLSRQPFMEYYTRFSDRHHCAIRTTHQVGDGPSFELVNLHLNPHSATWRWEELLPFVNDLPPEQRRLLKRFLIGDINDLSRFDHTLDLMAQIQRRGITKFGYGAVPCYDVTDMLRLSGFTDVADHLGTREATVPTPVNADPDHVLPLRVDYGFATEAALPLVQSFEVIRTPLTVGMSDHYPILLTLV